jgi:hypothetical protein
MIIMNSVAKLICGQRLPYTTISDSKKVSGTTVHRGETGGERGQKADHRAGKHFVVLVLQRARHVDDARAERAGGDREAQFTIVKHDQAQ